MADTFSVSSATLFNNPTLSDIKLKQFDKDTVREYYAHKAILCKESGFFLKAFTGSFKEATESSMELHHDPTELFQFMLKFIYSDNYNKDALAKLAGEDMNERGFLSSDIYGLADKYDVPKLYKPACEDLEVLLLDGASNWEFVSTMASQYYDNQPIADTSMGRVIVSVILANCVDHIHTADFEKMMLAYPVLAADIALNLQRKKHLNAMLGFTLITCNRCRVKSAVDLAVLRKEGARVCHCTHCKTSIDIATIERLGVRAQT